MNETPRQFHDTIILPGLDLLESIGGPRNTAEARVMLLAIARQEGGPQFLRHQTGGPAHGPWQFERGGGVHGVMYHPQSTSLARLLVKTFTLPWNDKVIYEGLTYLDGLACGFARLLLWTDPRPLPVDEDSGWKYYLRNWRPGKPRHDSWHDNWQVAQSIVKTIS